MAKRGSSAESASRLDLSGKKTNSNSNLKKEKLACICGDARCKELSYRIGVLNEDRAGFVSLPAAPKSDVVKVSGNRDIQRQCVSNLRQRWIKNLPNTMNLNKQTGRLAKIHFHPDITGIAHVTNTRISQLVIPKEMGKKMKFERCDMDPNSKSGEYYPIPNWSLKTAVEELEDLMFEAGKLASSKKKDENHKKTRNTSEGPLSTPNLECMSEIELTFAQMRRKIQMMEITLEFKGNNQKEIESRFELNGGLNRENLTSDEWHEVNPTAANNLFGFKNWKETKLYMCAFWDVVPPSTTHVIENMPLCQFEKLLITKMRFQLGLNVITLGFIWEKTRSHLGRIILKYSPWWGKVGRHLSNLQVTEDYLTHMDDSPTENNNDEPGS